ncbi:MAG TPA: GGDEF domain-containing protein [Thermoleophilaceae bacterium]|nr:GGDEF domain-containing protein [Thermoleophilaceae bacterium]
MAYRFSHPTVFTHARDSQASARLLIRRIGAVLFLLGGLTMVVTLFAPSAGRPPLVTFVPVGLACFGLAAYLGLAPRAADWVLLATPPLGTLLVTAIMSIEGTTSGTPFFYLWPMLVAAYFFQQRDVVLNFALVCASFGAALAFWVPVDDGSLIMFLDTVMAMGVVAGLVYMLKTQVGRLVTGMHKASTTDALTGVLNRGAFQQRLDEALTAPDQQPLVLALLDLDHFKLVNDRHGHPAGDRALRRFCEIVQAEARLDDELGRLGGEEFGLILAGTDLAGAHSFADRLRATVARETAAGEVGLTVSIGLSEARPATTSEDLLRSADVALYSAKGAGRNRVALYGAPALRPA